MRPDMLRRHASKRIALEQRQHRLRALAATAAGTAPATGSPENCPAPRTTSASRAAAERAPPSPARDSAARPYTETHKAASSFRRSSPRSRSQAGVVVMAANNPYEFTSPKGICASTIRSNSAGTGPNIAAQFDRGHRHHEQEQRRRNPPVRARRRRHTGSASRETRNRRTETDRARSSSRLKNV